MGAAAGLNSIEELREALLAAGRERDALMLAHAHAQHLLAALESLLRVNAREDPFESVFAALHQVFTFSHSMMLADSGESHLECIVGHPVSLVGSRWTIGPLFRKVLAGRVASTFSSLDIAEWRDAEALGLSTHQSALYLPVAVRERRGILVLLRAPGDEGFDRNDVELARRFSLLASHALAARYASQSEIETTQLRDLTAQLRASEHAAKRNADLLKEVVGLLPVGVTVQDEAGSFLLVNDAAAAIIGQPASVLTSADALPEERDNPGLELLRNARDDSLRSGTPATVEHTARVDDVPHTLLTTYKPVTIFEETLLLSATLDITERKRFEQELAHRAFHDQLTGLPNRTLVAELANAAVRQHRRGGMFALAFIDVDNFKQVNDYYSHATGDALLVAIAQRVTHNIRPGDTLARISGDEFLLLLNPLSDEADLTSLIERIVEALKQPFHVDGREVLTSACVGASIFPLHGADYETLRRNADAAMYRAKRSRKGSASYFDARMSNSLTARMDLEQRLRVATRERRFRAAFQPKVCIATRRVVGFEALVRWVEPDGTIHMPGTFIQVATELGLLDDLTCIVLEQVAADIPVLRERFGHDISVAMNVSARQIEDTQFMNAFLGQLADCGAAESIIVELTEDALVATQRFQRTVLPSLRGIGVRVSIDDFGTGYSSLSTLADITADEVKVDRAFISSIHSRVRSQGILRAIESLCCALDVDMLAEGVETEEELAYLRAHSSIRFAQGYLFSKPLFLEALVPADLRACA
jgi:diguanylate cyclase (GGDEF)-like protein